jgi:CHAT domain-containing protein
MKTVFKSLIVIIIILTASYNKIHGQNPNSYKIDSLYAELAKAQEDTSYVIIVLDLWDIGGFGNDAYKAIHHLNKALKISEKEEYDLGLFFSNEYLGDAYFFSEQSKNAEKHYKNARQNLFRVLKKNIIQKDTLTIAINNYNISRLYAKTQEYDSTKYFFHKAIDIADKLDENVLDIIATSLWAYNLSEFFLSRNNIEQSIYFAETGEEIAKKNKLESQYVIPIYNLLIHLYSLRSDMEQVDYYRGLLKEATKETPKPDSNDWEQILQYALEKYTIAEYKEALSFFKKAADLLAEYNDTLHLQKSIVLQYIGLSKSNLNYDEEFIIKDFISSIDYLKQIPEKDSLLRDNQLIVLKYNIYLRSSNLEFKIKYGQEAIELFEKITHKNRPTQYTISDLLILMGRDYINLGGIDNKDKSIYYFTKSMHIYNDIENKNQSEYFSFVNSISLLAHTCKLAFDEYQIPHHFDCAEKYFKIVIEESQNLEYSVFEPNAYSSLASLYLHNNQKEKAINYYTRSLELFLQLEKNTINVNGLPIAFDIADIYKSLGTCNFMLNNYADAINYAKKSISIYEELNVNFSDTYFKSYMLAINVLAESYFFTNNYSGAIEVFQKELELINIEPDSDNKEDKINNILAKIKFAKLLDNQTYSFDLLRDLIAHYEERSDNADADIRFNSLKNLSFLHIMSLDLEASLNTLLNLSKLLSKDNTEISSSDYFLPLLIKNLLKPIITYSEILKENNIAKDYLETMITEETIIEKDTLFFANVLLGLQKVNNRMGDYHESIENGEQLRKMLEHNKDSIKAMEIIEESNYELGLSYEKLENFESARKHYGYSKSLANNLEDRMRIARTYQQMGILLFKANNKRHALDTFKLALNYYTDICNDCYIKNCVNIANIYSELNEFESAQGYLEIALEISSQIYSDKRLSEFDNSNEIFALIYNGHGNIYKSKGNYNEALKYYQKSLNEYCRKPEYKHLPEIDNFPITKLSIDLLWNKASCLYVAYKGNDNKALLDSSVIASTLLIELIDKIRNNIITEEEKLFTGCDYHNIYEGIINIFTEANRQQDIYTAIEKNKSQVLLSLINKTNAELSLPEDIKLNKKRLQNELLSAKHKYTHEYDIQIHGQYIEAKNNYDNYLNELEKHYPDYYELRYSSNNINTNILQNNLSENQIMISYFMGDSTLTKILISNDACDVRQLSIDSFFNTNINDFNRFISQRRNTNQDLYEFQMVSNYLYNMLLQPFESYFNDSTSIIILPDGDLYKIPFEALVASVVANESESIFLKDIDFLIKHYPISYHYSATLWYNTKERARKRVENVEQKYFVAAPFSSDSYRSLVDLSYYDTNNTEEAVYATCNNVASMPATGTYGKAIYNLDSINSTFLAHTDATITNVVEEMQKTRFVNLLTHGCVVNGKNAYLAFFDDNKTYYTYLTIQDVFRLEMKADLLAMAACESGRGEILQGEGMMSFTRAFLYRGVNNIIYGLFKINSMTMSQIMLDFYKEYEQTNNYSKSLQKAKLKQIKNEQTIADWSSLILLGVD